MLLQQAVARPRPRAASTCLVRGFLGSAAPLRGGGASSWGRGWRRGGAVRRKRKWRVPRAKAGAAAEAADPTREQAVSGCRWDPGILPGARVFFARLDLSALRTGCRRVGPHRAGASADVGVGVDSERGFAPHGFRLLAAGSWNWVLRGLRMLARHLRSGPRGRAAAVPVTGWWGTAGGLPSLEACCLD